MSHASSRPAPHFPGVPTALRSTRYSRPAQAPLAAPASRPVPQAHAGRRSMIALLLAAGFALTGLALHREQQLLHLERVHHLP